MPADSDQTGERPTFFGATEPPGPEFLLHCTRGRNTATHAAPVLLVMGANDNVDREYADPNLAGSSTCAASCGRRRGRSPPLWPQGPRRLPDARRY